jgi:hypothetical protein
VPLSSAVVHVAGQSGIDLGYRMYQGGAHRLGALSGMAGSLLGLRLKKNLEAPPKKKNLEHQLNINPRFSLASIHSELFEKWHGACDALHFFIESHHESPIRSIERRN